MQLRPVRRACVAALLVLCASGADAAGAATPGTLQGVAALGSGSQLFGVAVQANGEAVAAGQAGGSTLVERFTAAGQPDPAFGSGGQAGGPSGYARGVAVQADGKIVAAGGGSGMFVERLKSDGKPDTGFGSGGTAVAGTLGASAIGYAVGIQPDGKIVVAGSINPIDTRIALARFNSNGTLDPSFGSGGAEVLDLGLPFAVAQGLAIQPDGKIVLAGHEQGSTTYAFFNGIVVRLNGNGGLDGSFAGGSGVYSFHRAGGGYDGFNAVALQNDGKIVVGGVATEANPSALFVRLSGAGAPDSSFGSSGVSSLPAGTFTSAPIGANGVVIAGGGRVVGAGAVQLNGTDYRAGLWAFTPAGAPDTEGAFSGGGVIDVQTGVESCGLAIAPDGTLVTVGDSVSATASSSAIPCTPNTTSTGFIARYVGFGPPPPPAAPGAAPTVSTGAASGISQISATVSGQVNPNGLATSYHFDYGPTPSYGFTTPSASAAAGRAATPVSVTLSGLTPGATYHYRIDASNSAGSSTGSDATFTTARAAAPSVSTGGARQLTEVSATISGAVASNGLTTKYHVEYGRKTAYGSSTATATLAAATSTVNVRAFVRGLAAGKTYHYRLVASNSVGTTYGGDRTFKTLPPLVTSFPRVGKTYRISSILTTGLALKVGCSQACSIKGSLQISTSVAKRLKLGKHGLSIGGGSASLMRGGSAKLVLRFNRASQGALKHAGRFTGTLRVTTSPVGGGKSGTLSKTITLRP